ncbi:MAG: hypothetical protein O2955_08725 [Planctomycetota bacterium]|nr:hypothetical protein [Planctomycetota bacterium]MDA1212589.1 hypothetical protein [Planctomycetota bacterium]
MIEELKEKQPDSPSCWFDSYRESKSRLVFVPSEKVRTVIESTSKAALADSIPLFQLPDEAILALITHN